MEFSTEELEGGITKVVMEGRLDIEGAAAVDLDTGKLLERREAKSTKVFAKWSVPR